jgi:phage gpG-like protein
MVKNEVPDFLEATKVIRRETAVVAGVEAVKFFKESFVKQGFTDHSFEAWKKTTNPLAGKRTLYNKGALMQSFQKRYEINKVIVESLSEYADIHNEGGEIIVTEKMKSWFWIKYAEIAKVPKVDGKYQWSKAKVKNAKTDFCKYMALMKAGSRIKIPKRKFMGNSKALMIKLESEYKKLIIKEMQNAFRKIK